MTMRSCNITLLLTLSALTGCGTDPLTRKGLWNASGVNERNIQAMLANPRDYVEGRGAQDSNGNLGAMAVRRYNRDKVPELPRGSSSDFQPGGNGESIQSPGSNTSGNDD